MLDAVVTKGKDVSFRCEVKSLSTEMLPSRPLWKKNGKDLDISKGCMDKKHLKVIEGFNNISIFLKDFECKADNSSSTSKTLRIPLVSLKVDS